MKLSHRCVITSGPLHPLPPWLPCRLLSARGILVAQTTHEGKTLLFPRPYPSPFTAHSNSSLSAVSLYWLGTDVLFVTVFWDKQPLTQQTAVHSVQPIWTASCSLYWGHGRMCFNSRIDEREKCSLGLFSLWVSCFLHCRYQALRSMAVTSPTLCSTKTGFWSGCHFPQLRHHFPSQTWPPLLVARLPAPLIQPPSVLVNSVSNNKYISE